MFITYKAPEPHIQNELVLQLMKKKPATLIVTIITATIATLIFWEVTDHFWLLSWLTAIYLISLLRFGLSFIYKRQPIEKRWNETWSAIHLFATMLAGICWGSFILFFDPSWPPHLQSSMLVVVIGILSAAFMTNSAVPAAFSAFFLPVLFMLLHTVWSVDNQGYDKVGYLFLAYSGISYYASYKLYQMMVFSLEMQAANIELNNQLLKSNRQLEQQAQTDPLTELANRRALNRFLSTEWKRHHRNKMPIAVLYIDIDYFKLFNDYYGHDHGDDCLQHIAKILKDSAARSSDLCSRLGGEEFIIVLPETDLDHAVFVADKIHSNLASSKFHHKASEISEYVTVSIGISSTVPDHATGEDVLIHNADQALYNAKESGRNQTACWKNNTKSEQT